jgi:cytochrome c biogenesis protein
MILRFLSSVKLTIPLMLGLAVTSIYGTFKPRTMLVDGIEISRYELFYQAPLFRIFLGLLALNLVVCTVQTIRRNLGDLQRFTETLTRAEGLTQRHTFPSDTDQNQLLGNLQKAGYTTTRTDEGIIGRKGRTGRWGSTIVHISVLIIMFGALLAETGFVGTLNIYVGDSSSTVYDWDTLRDRRLGFSVRLDHFEPIYYPLDLRFTLYDPDTNAEITTVTSREGETVNLPGTYSAQVRRYIVEQKLLVLGLYRQGRYLGEYNATPNEVKAPAGSQLGFVIRPTGYRDPMLKQLHSEVSIIEKGEVVRQGVIEVNTPLVHRGVAIYQTAYNRDKFGSWYAGFQFSKDPGEPLVWFGTITICLGLLLAFVVPYRAVALISTNGRQELVAISGFRAEAGREAFTVLTEKLNPGS